MHHLRSHIYQPTLLDSPPYSFPSAVLRHLHHLSNCPQDPLSFYLIVSAATRRAVLLDTRYWTTLPAREIYPTPSFTTNSVRGELQRGKYLIRVSFLVQQHFRTLTLLLIPDTLTSSCSHIIHGPRSHLLLGALMVLKSTHHLVSLPYPYTLKFHFVSGTHRVVGPITPPSTFSCCCPPNKYPEPS